MAACISYYLHPNEFAEHLPRDVWVALQKRGVFEHHGISRSVYSQILVLRVDRVAEGVRIETSIYDFAERKKLSERGFTFCEKKLVSGSVSTDGARDFLTSFMKKFV